ncbi:MAG TPA: queuosine salvage family protein [Candidatus Bathyarchaeia archaeon]|nr:queuosine salvage family protein [Candidatus Bathyarchaeia archaeon]
MELASAETAPRQVVESWNTLVERSGNEYVSVNHGALDQLVAKNPDLSVPDWRFPGQHADNDWAFASQTIVSSVLNYMFLDKDAPGGSWQMTNPKNGKPIASSNALHTRTYQVFGEAEDITSTDIFKLANPNTFTDFLPGIPMAESRRRLLGQFADELHWHYEGSVRNLLESTIDADGKMWAFYQGGAGLVDKLVDDNFGDAFSDYSNLDDLHFPFLKRAQLAPLLIQGRAQTSNTLPTVADIDKIGPVVDYQLPRALRHKGVLQYAPELANDADTWTPIPAQSRKEIEIRGATAYSVDYLLRHVNELRVSLGQTALNMTHVDFWLWKEGRGLKELANPPHPHFTETTAY